MSLSVAVIPYGCLCTYYKTLQGVSWRVYDTYCAGLYSDSAGGAIDA